MKTYYVVEHVEAGTTMWMAHPDGLLARLGIFNWMTSISYTATSESAEKCEALLRQYCTNSVRVVRRVTL